MAEISEVAKDIYLIETTASRMLGESGFPRSCLVYYLAATSPALVETGPGAAIPELMNAIRSIGDIANLRYAILTHIHLDHGGGAGALARELPQLQVVVHQRAARHLADPSRLAEASRQAFGHGFEEQYGPILPVAERQIRAVSDGEAVDLGNRRLTVVYAPGHASHQMAIFDGESRELFCGEALGRPQSMVVAPVSGFDPDVAIETMGKLKSLNPQVVFHSHGGVSRDPARLIASVETNMTAYRQIILDATRSGQARETIQEKLETYQRELSFTDWNGPHQVDDLIDWHLAYFDAKGLV
jgi:glyoxylase-like metal-dependent hydrolase (beta-lactamase superfamily II)